MTKRSSSAGRARRPPRARTIAALGAADDRAGDVELGGELGAAGDHELGRQLDPVHVAVDQLLELGDHLLGDAADPVFEALGRLGRGRQLGAGDEEVVLEAEDVGGELGVVGAAEGAGDAELRAGLVERRRRPRCGASCLATRPPYQSEVVPSSPFLV